MIYYECTCDTCGETFANESANCIDEVIRELKDLDNECDTGDKMLCEECMLKHQEKLEREDAMQFQYAKDL
jgi:hypothetical protein